MAPQKKKRKKPNKQKAPSSGTQKNPPDLHRLIKKLPALVFESEMAEVGYDLEDVTKKGAEGKPVPDIIAVITDQALSYQILVAINEIKHRAFNAKNDDLFFLADCARFYIEEYRGPAWDNPLLVALFYRSTAQKKGEKFNKIKCKKAVGGYEKTYKKLLQDKWKAEDLLRKTK